jgi:hypothetical protein
MRVRELLVLGGGAIVLRNIREPSEELRTPLSGDVRRPRWFTLTRKAHQQRRVLKSHRHLADGEVEHVGLQPPAGFFLPLGTARFTAVTAPTAGVR